MKAKRSSPKRNSYGGLIALLVIGAGGVYAIAVYIKQTPEAQHVPTSVRRHDTSVETTPSAKGDEKASVQVLTPKSHGGNLTFDSASADVPAGVDPVVFAVNQFLTNSHITPASAKALGEQVKDGVAYIDFTEAMDKTYGSSDEAALLQGLCRTLAQFPEIKKAQFLVSGKPIDSFGSVSLDPPIDVRKTNDSSTLPGA